MGIKLGGKEKRNPRMEVVLVHPPLHSAHPHAKMSYSSVARSLGVQSPVGSR